MIATLLYIYSQPSSLSFIITDSHDLYHHHHHLYYPSIHTFIIINHNPYHHPYQSSITLSQLFSSKVCVNEALKLITYASQTVNNYLMYIGNEGLYTPTFIYDKSDLCIVCSDAASTRTMNIDSSMKLKDFIILLSKEPSLQLIKPSIISEMNTIYMQKPPSLELILRTNLEKTLYDLINDGEILTITDPTLKDISLSIQIQFNNNDMTIE